ncbi:MAG: transposase [Caldilineaceae bacterium]|nr:transposase [Caldilineaceae bacterium]
MLPSLQWSKSPSLWRGITIVKKRRKLSAAYKLRVALEALEGSKTISQLSSENEIHANLIRAWKRQLLEDGPGVFASNGERKQRELEAQEAELYEQIGRLKTELEWLKKKLPASVSERLKWAPKAGPRAKAHSGAKRHNALP